MTIAHHAHTVLLASREQQPIKGVTSLWTDFETHAYVQGYTEEHPTPVIAVTHLFGDGDLDAHHHKVKALAVKEFMARRQHGGRTD